MEKFFGKLADIYKNEVYDAEISVDNGRILRIERCTQPQKNFILPGLVDAHIHIESSMLTPQNFARIALSHGTVATVSDPHEIANVLGVEGVKYMIRNAEGSKMKIYFGAPSCVPATDFESSGARLSPEDIESLFVNEGLGYLSEMMNYPGVIYGDPEVTRKIEIARKHNKRIDGHAPGLSGKDLSIYAKAGIDTDHECSDIKEALEKIENGMYIQIREGSAARNFEALWPLIDSHPDKVFLCSDDLHPDDLLKGHINRLLKKGVEKKVDLFNLIRSVSINPVKHYNLDIGLLRVGDRADFIMVKDLTSFEVLQTIVEGKIVFDSDLGIPQSKPQEIINNFHAKNIIESDLVVKPEEGKIKVIQVKDGELVTDSFTAALNGEADLVSDTSRDILKLVVLNRYKNESPSIGFINNFKLKKGAIASSIAHDSHNIIATGVSNREIAECINWIVSNKGGIAVHDGNKITGIPLPVAGIVSDQPAEYVAEKYEELNFIAGKLGCDLRAPFMTLSFMALLVIPELKLSNQGLFDGKNFRFTSLFETQE
ncbi:MAG: adenine deaminase [Bacteroidales bacterium]|nr:adenine deaminase [Bacteroidales bacterium]